MKSNVKNTESNVDEDINYTKEAFLNSWNLTFLVVALLSAAGLGLLGSGSLFTVVLFFAAATELLFLGIVPRHKRFRRAVRARRQAERHKPPSQKELYRHLDRKSQRRYARLRRLEEAIEENYRKLSYASQGLLKSHLHKIDGLLASYLNLLHRRGRYCDHPEASSESEVTRSIDALREELQEDASPRVRAVKERRLRILQQRLERFREGHQSLEVIEAQLQTIEDVVKYVHEQSWTLQNPEEITLQLDTLLDEVEETRASVREVEEIFDRPSAALREDELEDDLDAMETPPGSRPRRRRSR